MVQAKKHKNKKALYYSLRKPTGTTIKF